MKSLYFSHEKIIYTIRELKKFTTVIYFIGSTPKILVMDPWIKNVVKKLRLKFSPLSICLEISF